MLSVLTANNAVGTDDSCSFDTGVPSVSSRSGTVLDWSIHRGCLALVYVLIHLNLHCFMANAPRLYLDLVRQ